MTLREQLEALDRYWDHAGILLARTMQDDSIRDLAQDRMTAMHPVFGDTSFRRRPHELMGEAREEVADGFTWMSIALFVAHANGDGRPLTVVRSAREP